jgi:hypothetical protein
VYLSRLLTLVPSAIAFALVGEAVITFGLLVTAQEVLAQTMFTNLTPEMLYGPAPAGPSLPFGSPLPFADVSCTAMSSQGLTPDGRFMARTDCLAFPRLSGAGLAIMLGDVFLTATIIVALREWLAVSIGWFFIPASVAMTVILVLIAPVIAPASAGASTYVIVVGLGPWILSLAVTAIAALVWQELRHPVAAPPAA